VPLKGTPKIRVRQLADIGDDCELMETFRRLVDVASNGDTAHVPPVVFVDWTPLTPRSSVCLCG
jgi:hypothetical protein